MLFKKSRNKQIRIATRGRKIGGCVYAILGIVGKYIGKQMSSARRPPLSTHTGRKKIQTSRYGLSLTFLKDLQSFAMSDDGGSEGGGVLDRLFSF